MSNNNITSWLKKIFSLQTISVLVAIFAAYFTYKTYTESQISQLSIEMPVLNDSKDEITYVDANGISRYFSLGFYSIPPVSINNGMIGGPDNMILFPVISNNSDKSLKDFSADIYIWHDNIMSSLFEQSKGEGDFYNLTSYNVVSEDENNTHLSYNKDFLGPNLSLPNPINSFMLFLANEKISSLGGVVGFVYYITYDGAKVPIRFQYNLKMFYNEDWDINDENRVPSKFISQESYRYLRDDVFSNPIGRRNYEDGEWVFIINNKMYRNFKHLTSDEFTEMDDVSYKNLHD